MIYSHGMFFINIILFSLIIFLIYIWRFILNKKVNPFYLIILFSLLPLLSISRIGSYESGDLTINAIKLISYVENIKQGEIIPYWAGELNATYGYPMFIFTYPLPYFISALFNILGFSYLSSIKLFLIVSYIASGITSYFYLKELLNDKRSAAIGSILYLYAPYHLVVMHFRVDIGELASFLFLPLIFLFITKFIKTEDKKFFVFTSFATALLLLSHQAISLAFFPFSLIYCIFIGYYLKSELKIISTSIFSVLSGLLLASFYVLPVIYYSSIIIGGEELLFPKFYLFLFSPWRLGFLFQGPYGQLSYPIGYVQITLIFIGIYFLFKKRVSKYNKLLIFFTLSFFTYAFMLSSISKPIWETLPFFDNFQFTYRLMVIISFLASIIGAITALKLNNKTIIIITFMAISLTILNWGNRRNTPETTNSSLFINYPLNSAKAEGLVPAMPVWSGTKNVFKSIMPKGHLEVASDSGKVVNLERKNISHSYLLYIKKDSLIKENTLYFPGWEVFANNKKIVILNKYPIQFRLSKGLYKIDVNFKRTPIIKLGLLISALTTILLTLIFFIPNKYFFKLMKPNSPPKS